MPDLEAILKANRDALADMAAAGERSGADWTTPRAPGKWSPSQVVEHVARILEESAHVVLGEPSRLPRLPGFLRPLMGVLFFKPILKKGRFVKAKTNRPMDPEAGPATPADGKGRLDGAMALFEQACRTRAASGLDIRHPVFGTVSVADYARFQELHTRHHTRQIPEPRNPV